MYNIIHAFYDTCNNYYIENGLGMRIVWMVDNSYNIIRAFYNTCNNYYIESGLGMRIVWIINNS